MHALRDRVRANDDEYLTRRLRNCASFLLDQRAALDRQARIIEEQGRTLSALQQQVEAATRGQCGHGFGRRAGRATAAGHPNGGRARRRICPPRSSPLAIFLVRSAFPAPSRRSNSAARRAWSPSTRLSALGTDDRFVTSSIPVGVPRAGDEARTVYSPVASRLSTELRMPSREDRCALFIETDFAGDGRTTRLRHAFLQTNRFVVGQTWSTFSDPRPTPIGIDFEGLNAISLFRQPLNSAGRRTARALPAGPWRSRIPRPISRALRPQPDARLRRQAEIPARPKRGVADSTRITSRRRCWFRQLRGEAPAQADAALATGGIGGNISGVLVPRWDARRPHQVCRLRRFRDRTLHRRLAFARRTGCGVRPDPGQPSRASRLERLPRVRARLVASVHHRRDLRRRQRQQPRYSAGRRVPPDPAWHRST